MLDLNLSTGEIDQASIVWYWTDAGTKWYEACDIDGLELVVINAAKRQWVVLLKLDDVYMLLLEGKVKGTDIGTGTKENIAKDRARNKLPNLMFKRVVGLAAID